MSNEKHKHFIYRFVGRGWPGNYALIEDPIFNFGLDGEEGIYFDDLEFIEFLEKAYEEYLKQKEG